MVPTFRFAPSPNGFLHYGHAYSALLNAKRAREREGRFLIRMEDIDTQRCPRALGDAALEDLAWLGLRSDEPVVWQSERLALYEKARQYLQDQGLIYQCHCTRKTLASHGARAGMAHSSNPLVDPDGQPLYSGSCKRMPPPEGPAAWRLDMEKLASRFPEAAVWGDVVIARRDIGTSYHLAVVMDDARQGISHVVRGADLLAATPLHRMLQDLLGLPQPHYEHHALIMGETGQKLSKSVQSKSLRSLRQEGMCAEAVRQSLGFSIV